MKKRIFGYISIGLTLGLVAAAITFSSNLFGPVVTNAADVKSKPNYIKTREQVNELPIVKDTILSANKNYSYLQGTVISTDKATGVQSKTNLWIEQPNRFRVEYIPDVTQLDVIEESVNNGDDIQTKGIDKKIKKSMPIKSIWKPKIIEENAIYPDYNGTFLPIGGVNEMLHPEIYTQSVFRRGQLTIIGEEEFLTRKVTLIQVDFEESKLGNRQNFWIDNKTGIILKTEIYDNDKVLQSMAFESIEFPAKIDDSKFRL